MKSQPHLRGSRSTGSQGLTARVDEYIRRQDLLHPAATVLVGVSGGPDSVALLHILHELQPCWNLRLLVCHLDHGLRPGESAEDARFVAALAEKLGLPAVHEACDVAALARAGGLGLEEAGRKARYAFFEQSRIRHQADRIALGHTADDQVETVFHHLMRGTGLRGLGGMAPVRDGLLVRPLLGVWRSEIIRYLDARNLAFRTDSSNTDPAFLRNRLRHSVLPQLRQACGPGIDQAIHRLALTAREDHQYLESCVLELGSQMLRRLPDGSIEFGARELLALPAAMRRRLVLRAFELCSPAGCPWEFVHVEQVLRLAEPGQRGRSVPLLHGLLAERQFDRLSICPRPECAAQPFELECPVPGQVACVEGGWELLASAAGADPSSLPGQESCSRSVRIAVGWLPERLTVRSFRDGDRWSPDSRKKVKESWNSGRVPRMLRSRVPLVFSGSRLLWIPGLPAPAGASRGSAALLGLEFRCDPGTPLGRWLAGLPRA